MRSKPTEKIYHIRRVIGRYEVTGTLVCIPAPRPGLESALVSLLIEDRVNDMVKEKMVTDLLR
jgi:hypothetical protein